VPVPGLGNNGIVLGQLGRPFRGRTALLSPTDRLVVDRKRLAEIFEYHQAGSVDPAA
jgi:uncharacterized protein